MPVPSNKQSPSDLKSRINYFDPNEVLYERRCARYMYVAPEGLRELMTDISREVIKRQPTNIFVFIADYLDTLLMTRENAKVAIKLVEDVQETGELKADLLQNTSLTRSVIDKSARIIQNAFKVHLQQNKKYKLQRTLDQENIKSLVDRLSVSSELANSAAAVIQRAYLVHRRKIESRMKAANEQKYSEYRQVDWYLAAQRTLGIYKDIRGISVKGGTLHKAAVLIQAAYKGYYTRKLVRNYLNSVNPKHSSLASIIERFEKVENKPKRRYMAALVIQKFFRRIVDMRKQERAIAASASFHSDIYLLCPAYEDKSTDFIAQIANLGPEHDNISLHINTSSDELRKFNASARIIQTAFRKYSARKKEEVGVDAEEHAEEYIPAEENVVTPIPEEVLIVTGELAENSIHVEEDTIPTDTIVLLTKQFTENSVPAEEDTVPTDTIVSHAKRSSEDATLVDENADTIPADELASTLASTAVPIDPDDEIIIIESAKSDNISILDSTHVFEYDGDNEHSFNEG